METIQFCKKENIEDIRKFVHRTTQFINLYRWIVDAYVSDFFTHGHWEKLSTSWTNVFSQMEPPELALLLGMTTENRGKDPLPLSLLAFKHCCQAFSLPRNQIDLADASFQDLFHLEFDNQGTSVHGHSENACSLKDGPENYNSYSCLTGSKKTQRKTGERATCKYGPGDCKSETEVHIKTKSDQNKVSQVETEFGVSETDGQAKSMIKHGQYLPLHHCFRKHIKPKKQHEILQLGQVINLLGKACDCKHAVDVGAGQGHLSRILNFGFGFKVTTVEAAGCHAPKAQKFDKDIQKDLKRSKLKRKFAENEEVLCSDKELMSENLTLPEHVTCTLQPNTSLYEFLHVVQSSFRKQFNDIEVHSQKQYIEPCQSENTDLAHKTGNDKNINDPKKTEDHGVIESDGIDANQLKFILTGLHACGDLTPTILRVYAKCADIIGLASVSCCYMKLSCNSKDDIHNSGGYPMSKFVKNLPDHYLSYEAREMACHFADSYRQRLTDNSPNLKLHCYRAALQYIISKINHEFQRGCIKLTVKNADNMEFKRYAEICLKRLGMDNIEIPTEVIQTAESFLPLWKKVVAFYTVRLALAPVIETLILLDRMLFLHEEELMVQRFEECILRNHRNNKFKQPLTAVG